MAKPRFDMKTSRYHHEALRDTQWVGKGTGAWWVVLGVVALAAALAFFLN